MTLSRLMAALLVLLTLAVPAAASPLTLTGEVFYRERMALPPGATLHVSLVTLPDGRAVVGAGAAIEARGQVPLAFTLNIRSDVAGRPHGFGLVAEIRHAGVPLFRNDRPVPVDVTAPEPVSILLHRVVRPPAPPVEPAVPEPVLLDTLWRVTSIGARPVLGGRPVTLSIAADHRAGGNGGCNNYFTEASFEADRLTFGPAAATRMVCAPEIMAQEAAYFAALAAVAGFELGQGSLRLLDAAGVPLVGLVPLEDD